MEGVVEGERRALEELDRFRHAICELLVEEHSSQKGRVRQELTASAYLDQMQKTAQNILTLYGETEEKQKELEKFTISPQEEATDGFGEFYSMLKSIKDVHRRFPADRPIDDSEFQALLNSCRLTDEKFEALFSGEESFGKYIDLVSHYDLYINLKGNDENSGGQVRKLDYLQYLGEFDNFVDIPKSTKLSHSYSKYLNSLLEYLESFINRALPLFDLDTFKQNVCKGAEEKWKLLEMEGWLDEAKKDLENTQKGGILCGPCGKIFTNQSTFEAHLNGKKHLRALEKFDQTSRPLSTKIDLNSSTTGIASVEDCKAKNLAIKETLIVNYMSGVLAEIRQETQLNVERKQTRTLDEREEDAIVEQEDEDEEGEEQRVGEEQEDGGIYNPKNLPLDWDGKPIPYWLWKLHGLGIRYPCEICGNHVYMGKKAFDQHFFEWRHSNGMKALGIPNTKHFFQITSIEEAMTMWDKLKQKVRSETFRPEAMEEFEDHLGNVYNRKTYEDLRRQGLI